MLRKIALMMSLIMIFSHGANALELPKPNAVYQISGANDVKIAVQEWGNPGGDVILFSHAWSLNHIAWLPQLRGKLAKKYRLITYDLRGHGNSGKPSDEKEYNNADVWADDMNSIISSLKLNNITIVGWSYSSVIVADYIKKYGEHRLKAANFVGSLSGLNVERIGKYFGSDFDPVTATSENAEVEAFGMVKVNNIMVPTNIDRDTYGVLLASSMKTPKFVRLAMLNRSIDHKKTYEMMNIPVLFTHGLNDNAVKAIAAEEGAKFVKQGILSLYEGANHGPNWADPKRFNEELDRLVSQVIQ